MLNLDQAQDLAAKFHKHNAEFKQDGEFWLAWVPGRTSVMTLIGPDGGVLCYHIAEKTDEQAKADYLNGERSQVPNPESNPPVGQRSEEELEASRRVREESHQKIAQMIDEHHAKSE